MSATAITTSWDDGQPMDLRVAEMLTRHGLLGTFYIPRYWSAASVMTDKQIRELAASHEVGGHTVNHVVLTSVTDAQAQTEITDGRDWLAEVTGKAVAVFCPPCGKFKSRHRRIIADAGFIGFRTVECWSIDGTRHLDGTLEMPTTCQAFPHGMRTHVTNVLKRRNGDGLGLWLRTYGWNWVSQIERAARLTVRQGGVFHLWGHSWEIERYDLWDGLERVFATLGELTHIAEAKTNGQICRETTWRRLRRQRDAAVVGTKATNARTARDLWLRSL